MINRNKHAGVEVSINTIKWYYTYNTLKIHRKLQRRRGVRRAFKYGKSHTMISKLFLNRPKRLARVIFIK